MLKESERKKKLMLNAIIRIHEYLKSKYKIKLEKGYAIIKTLLILIPKSLFKLRGKN